MPEVSVLVPTFNHAEFVERSLKSVFAQTFPPKRLIVIDDGSKDESASVIAEVIRNCPFESKFLVRENRGLCATLNEGFSMSDGDYFAYLGSDDVWLPEFLDENIKLLESRPNAVLAFGHAYVIDENDQIIDRTDNWTAFDDGDPLSFLLRGEIFSSPSVVYRRTALEKHRWNEDAKLEDYEMYLRLSAEGEFAKSEKILCAWRQHGTNTSRDVAGLLPEFISAQNRLADRLGLSRHELDKIQTKMKFDAAANFVRYGSRREAFALLMENARGAGSPVRFAKTLFRIAVPRTLFQWNRRRKQKKLVRQCGKLEPPDIDAALGESVRSSVDPELRVSN